MNAYRKLLFLCVALALLAACENPAAKEEPKEYSVTYDPNFATGGTAPAAQTKEPGEPLTLAANSGALVREGFSFVGWNTMANGYGTHYSPGANYGADAPLKLYAQWNIVPAGGVGNLDLKGQWMLGTNSTIFTNVAFTNAGITIQADFPDVVYSYNNTGDTAVLFWRLTGEFAKISWAPAYGGYRVQHSAPVANLNLLADAPDTLEYYLVPEYADTVSPIIISSDPAEGSVVPKSTPSMSITFSRLMNRRVSCTPSGAIVASPPTITWSHNYELRQSTLTLGAAQFSETPGPVSIQFFSAMTDCDGNPLVGKTISFSTY